MKRDTMAPFFNGTSPQSPRRVAGLTAAAVVLPKAMAYATVAGLPVSVGLYTAFVPMIVYALLGTSRVLSVSSTTTLAILAGTQLGLAVPDGDPGKLITATATLTALTGALLIAASVLRLGFVANFISAPVLTGFKAGIGLVIVLDQVPKLLGVHITKEGFLRDILSVAHHLPDTSLSLSPSPSRRWLALLAMERLWPHSPAPLVVVTAGIGLSWLAGLDCRASPPSVHSTVAAFDHPPASRSRPAAPAWSARHRTDELHRDDCRRPSLRRARRAAHQSRPRASCDGGRQPVRRLLRRHAGRRRDFADRGGPRRRGADAEGIPRHCRRRGSHHARPGPAPRAVAAKRAGRDRHRLLDRTDRTGRVRSIRSVRRMEFRWALAAFLGVLVFGTLQGIVVAIVLSMVGLPVRSANANIYVIGRKRGSDVPRPLSAEHPDDETFGGLLILRPEGRLFFANAQQVADQIQALVSSTGRMSSPST